jgi:MSHA biogenesis protein MshQ
VQDQELTPVHAEKLTPGISFAGIALLFMLTMAWSMNAIAVCSAYKGRATINEVHRNGNSTRFVEVKILDASITSASYDGWSVRICSSSAGCTGNISLSNPLVDDSGYPWIVIPKPLIGHKDLLDIASSGRMDIMFRDESGRTIDYFSVGGYNNQRDWSCTPAYDWQFDGSNSHTAMRLPDGTGDWAIEGPGGSVDPTDSDTNDVDGNGKPLPVADIINPDPVVRGTPVVFTVFLPDGPIGHDVSFRYDTIDDTAMAGVHYVAASGTAVIPAGESAVNITVQTRVYMDNSERYFYLRLSNQTGAGLNNHFAIATIRPDLGLVAEYRMEEAGWAGASGEVADVADSHPGTGFGDATTGWQTPALAGNPGTCRYGIFDGNGDYVQVPHASALNGEKELTYTAWIHPYGWSGTRQVMGKGIHSDSQMGIFAEGGVLKGRAATNSGTVEVQTALPPTGSWTHVALTFRATDVLGLLLPSATLRLYVDGVEAASKKISGGLFGNARLKSSSTALLLGNDTGRNYFFSGYLDEVRVYDSELSRAWIQTIMQDRHTCPAGPGVHHIEILHDGAALTCEPETVTLRACGNADCSMLFTSEDVTVTLVPSGWVDGDTITFNGSTNGQLRKTTPGSVTLGTAAVVPAPLAATTCLVGTTANCSLAFADAGFVFDVPNLTACKISGDVALRAVKKSDDGIGCGPAFSGTRRVRFWSGYSAPSSGTRQVVINGTAVGQSAAAATELALDFDANGAAVINVRYDDAGQVRLDAQYSGSDAEAGLELTGNDFFAGVPVGLAVYSTEPAAVCPSPVAHCSPFKKAGAIFDLRIKAACWESDTDTDLADNAATPNYRQLAVPLTHQLVEPSPGATGSLGVSSVDLTNASGITTVSQSVSEVGVYRFTAMPAADAYFGSTVPGGTSTDIGRFYPDHFTTSIVEAGSFADACGGFTYTGQPFGYQTPPSIQVTARNAADEVTANYKGDFNKLEAGEIAIGYPDADASQLNAAGVAFPVTHLTSARTMIDNGDGTTTFTLTDTFAYNRIDGQVNPFTADLAIDLNAVNETLDGVVAGDLSTPKSITPIGTEVRYGSGQVTDVYGGTGAVGDSLTLPLASLYWHDGWRANTADGCSLVNYAAPTDPDGTGITVTPVAGGTIFVAGGLAGLTLTVTGDDAVPGGRSNVLFTWPPYLTGPASATASFGIFRGDDRLLHWREP